MKSPGHKTFPDHRIRERHLPETVRAEVHGEVVAESRDVIELAEDGHPTRYYFPRADVAMDKLERTDTTSKCPFKGTAHYYSLRAGGESVEDGAWTYETPYDEHRELQDRIAFYDDQRPGIHIELG